AFEIADHDLLSDARDMDHAPLLAGPGLRDPDPARAFVVFRPLAVPVEVDLDAAILVGPDLLARGSGDNRRLRALDAQLGGGSRRAVRGRRRDAGERVAVAFVRRISARQVAPAHAGPVPHADQHVALARLPLGVVPFEL